MLPILDRYIIRKFLGTFFFTISLLLLISVVFDIAEKIDDFLENQAPIDEIIFDYYINFVVYFGNLFSSLITFIAVIIFTSKMASNTEIIAILNSGVSFKRMMRPYLIAATLIASINFAFSNWIIPITNQSRLDFTYKYLKNPPSTRYKNLHRQVKPGVYLYFETFNSARNIGYQFNMETFNDNQLVTKFQADYLRWDDNKSMWRAENYVHREILPDNSERLSYGAGLDTSLIFDPAGLVNQGMLIETMNYSDLNEFIAMEKARGAENVHFYEVEKHQRMSYPFSTFILTFIAACIATRKKRGGMGVHLAFGLALSVIYILFMKVSTTFATNGNLSPMLAVWIPNIVFTALSFVLYRKVQK
ncbi:MAG: lipopolysaccharide export system permease protein [Flavobacteriales bacterium]|jgi:lipopolysaccharide export system permease protein